MEREKTLYTINHFEIVSVFCIYTLLVLFMTYPVLLSMENGIAGDGGDAQLFVWNFWWMKHSLCDLHQNPFFSDYLFNPIGVSLVFHTFTPLYGLLSLPFQLIISPVMCYNLVFFSTFILTGWLMYLLVRVYGLDKYGAFIAGFSFTFCPARMARSLGHLNLLSTQWLPLFFLFLFFLFRTGKRRYAIATGLTMVATFYTSYQLFVLLCLCLIFIFPLYFLHETRSSHSSEDQQKISHPIGWLHILINHIKSLTIIGIIGLLFTGPLLFLAYEELEWEGNYVSEYSKQESFPTDLIYYINPFHEASLLKRSNIRFRFPQLVGTEKMLSPGIMTVILAIIGLFSLKIIDIKRPWTCIWIILIVVFFVLSLGSKLIINGADTGMPLPYRYYRLIPLFSGVRVPGKMALFVAFGLSILAGIGMNRLAMSRKKIVKYMGFIVVLVMFAEVLAIPFPVQKCIDPSNLAKQTPLGKENTENVFHIPFGIDTGFRTIGRDISRQYMMEQMTNLQRLVSGHVSRCSNDTLEYFYMNPLLNRIAELQSSKSTRSIMLPGRIMKKIAREWINLTQTERIIITRFDGQKFLLTDQAYIATFNFIHQYFPFTDMHSDMSKSIFTFEPEQKMGRWISFDGHPENDVYIFNRFFQNDQQKFVSHDYIETWHYFRFLYPISQRKPLYLTITYKGMVFEPGDDQKLLISLNRHTFSQLPYCNEWQNTTVQLPQQLMKLGVNTLQLTYSEEHTSINKSDKIPFSISVVSSGMNYIGHGVAQIRIPYKDYSRNSRGFNVVYINPETGRVMRSEVYDTCESELESSRLASDIKDLEEGTIVVAAINDDGSNKYNDELEKALHLIGSQQSLRRKFRYAYAIIGKKGMKPGEAQEKCDENIVTMTHGNGLIGVKNLLVHELPDPPSRVDKNKLIEYNEMKMNNKVDLLLNEEEGHAEVESQ